MALLSIPSLNTQYDSPKEIHTFLNSHGIFFDQWKCDIVFDDAATQDEILAAYSKDLVPFMENSVVALIDMTSAVL